MAKIKKAVIIIKIGSVMGECILHVWADNIISHEILEIEGISNINIYTRKPATICVDPRYDVDEIIKELEELLSAKIPNVFYDNSR